jgi:eukaryotic-like serine/threonine-protein kinase
MFKRSYFVMTILVMVSLTILVCGCDGTTPSTAPTVGPTITVSSSSYDYTNYKTFTDSGIAVQYPSDWTLNVHQGDIFGARSHDVKAEFSISATELSDKSTTLDSYVDGGIRYITSSYNANILANDQLSLNGLNARQTIYTMKESGTDVKSLQVYTIKDSKVYVLTFVSKPADYDSYINQGKAILASFQFI